MARGGLDRPRHDHVNLRHNRLLPRGFLEPAMATDTFLATFGLIGLRLVELHGIDPQQFAAQLGIAAPALPEARARLPSTLVDAGFARATALIADPAFALRAAECWHPSNLGTLGYAWLSSGTLRTGLKRLVRYCRTLGTKTNCRCADERAGLRFVFEHRRGDTAAGHAIADFWLSLVLAMCRTNLGRSLHPIAVNLRRPRPANTQPYVDFFACSVRFSAAEDSFVLAHEAVDTPLPTANKALAGTFDAILAEQLSALDETDLPARCKDHLLQQLTSGEPSEEELAAAMCMSRRTLQRRLGCLEQSYQRLLDDTRHGLALRYLGDTGKTLTEIAFLLGFSEQSAFSRSFKRWHGTTPTAFRAQRLAAGA